MKNINTTSTQNQNFGIHTVSIMVSTKSHQRFARITTKGSSHNVPIELLGLAAGKDWMRNILVKCASCHSAVKASEMENGTHCQDCYDAQGEENARQDAEDAKNSDFLN